MAVRDLPVSMAVQNRLGQKLCSTGLRQGRAGPARVAGRAGLSMLPGHALAAGRSGLFAAFLLHLLKGHACSDYRPVWANTSACDQHTA